MSDETPGAPAPETPEPQPAATPVAAPAPAVTPTPPPRRRGVEVPRWVAVVVGAVLVFVAGFGIARATNDGHGGHERDRQSAVARGGDNRGNRGAGDARAGNRNGDDTGRSGSSGSSQQGGAAPHTGTRGS